jgi:hypothetical protein
VDAAMTAAAVSAVIGALGTVVGALIQSYGRWPREDEPPAAGTVRPSGGVTEVGLAAVREASPDDHR